jgi:hypothetical protein
VPEARSAALAAALEQRGVLAARIGRLVEGQAGWIRVQ